MCSLTRSCFFLLFLKGFFLHAFPFLFGTCLPSLWSCLFPPRSRSDPLLFCQGAALAHLDSLPFHDLVLWTESKGGSGARANCTLCGTKATVFFLAGPVCSSFFAEAGVILQALRWSRQHQQVCRYVFSSLTLALLPLSPLLRPSFYLKLSVRSGRNCLFSSPLLSGYNGSSETRFSRRTTWLMSWSDRSTTRYVISRIRFFFYRTGGILSHLNSLAHRFPRCPRRNLRFLVTLAVSSFVFAATDTVWC